MMNCPNCNKEISPEWELCPFCGYKPRKCSNPNCHSGWLPQEARFCPECGSKIGGDASSVTEKTVPKPEHTPHKSQASIVSAPAGSSKPSSRSTSTSTTRTTSSLSKNPSYTPRRRSSSSSSVWKRIARFIGAFVLGVFGFVFLTEKEYVILMGNVVEKNYDFFTFGHIMGAVMLVLAFKLLINAFTKD